MNESKQVKGRIELVAIASIALITGLGLPTVALKAMGIHSDSVRALADPLVEPIFVNNLIDPYAIAGDRVLKDVKLCLGKQIKSQQLSVDATDVVKLSAITDCGRQAARHHVMGERIADAEMVEKYFALNGLTLYADKS